MEVPVSDGGYGDCREVDGVDDGPALALGVEDDPHDVVEAPYEDLHDAEPVLADK